MTDVLHDLLGALKDGRAGRQPDPSSTRGSRPKEQTQSVESVGPLHRISEASVTGTGIVDAPADAVNVLADRVHLVLPEHADTPAAWQRRDALDALCGAPLHVPMMDSEEVDYWRARHEREKRKWEEEGFDVEPLSPERQAKVDRSKQRERGRAPIEQLADVTAPADPEPVAGPGRVPGANHPWRRYPLNDPAESGEGRAA